MYLVNVIETEKEKKKEGEIDGEIGKVRKSFGKIVLKEYHSGFSLFFPTQCSSAIFMIIATQYFSLFHFVFMWSKGGPTSEVLPINLVLFGGHSDNLRVGTDLHQSKVNLRTFPKQSNKKPSPQTWKVRKLAKSWNQLELRP